MNDIASIDKNFLVKTRITENGVKFYDAKSSPFLLHGIFHDGLTYRRIPKDTADKIPGLTNLSKYTAGGRVRFKTDSPYVAINAKMSLIGHLPHMALSGSSGFDMYENNEYLRSYVPPYDMSEGYEGIYRFREEGIHDLTINFPLYSGVDELYIGIDEKSKLLPAGPYKIEKPVVFYGSSITEGGCASRPGNSYENMLSCRFDFDYINLGFSGNAKADDVTIEYVKGLDMSVFVYDYDHNAPNLEHLINTHEKMFRAIRDAHPDLPIICMPAPEFNKSDEWKRREEVVKNTYQHALDAGDKKVYFIDSATLMKICKNEGTVDGCHPNDLGFFSMACALGDVLEKIFYGEN